MHPLSDPSSQNTAKGQLKARLDEARRKTAELWSDFSTFRDNATRDGASLSEGSAELKKLDRLHATYTEASSEAKRLEDELMDMIGREFNGGGLTIIAGRKSKVADEFIRKGVEAKAFDQTSGSIAVNPFYDDIVHDLPSRATLLLSQVPTTTTNGDKVVFTRQTAAVTSENVGLIAPHGQKPTTEVGIERVEEDVKVIATLSEALDRSLLKDQDALRDFVGSQLVKAVLLKLEEQVIAGDGDANTMRGILNTAGLLSVDRDSGADETAWEAIFRGIMAVRANFIEPTLIALNPNDWAPIRLAKDGYGRYLGAEVVASDPQRLWGVPVLVTPAVPEGTGIVGNPTESAQVWARETATIEWTQTGLSDDGESELFQKNEFRCRAEMRAAFGVIHAGAFCEVTGI